MYKKLFCIIIWFTLATFYSCGDGSGANSGDTGKLVVNITNSSEELTPATYIITGKEPADASFIRTISSGEGSAEIDHLVFGDWTINWDFGYKKHVS